MLSTELRSPTMSKTKNTIQSRMFTTAKVFALIAADPFAPLIRNGPSHYYKALEYNRAHAESYRVEAYHCLPSSYCYWTESSCQRCSPSVRINAKDTVNMAAYLYWTLTGSDGVKQLCTIWLADHSESPDS